jgi:hypothetical protein
VAIYTTFRHTPVFFAHINRSSISNDAAFGRGDYQKIQLAHLLGELKGPAHSPSPDRKKSELVAELAELFADAAEGRIEDKKLAERLNSWLPSNLRPDAST